MSATAAAAYDQLPYVSRAITLSHPVRMAGVARLFGLGPVPMAEARILELGCAGGGNLLPLAAAWPGCECVGIDYSPVQIRQAEGIVASLGLGNIRFLCQDVSTLSEDLGHFDYIIAHGLYSWVPTEVREAILPACARLLTANGLVYISFNTLPGWHHRAVLRDLFLLAGQGSPDQRQATKAGVERLLQLARHAQGAGGGTPYQRCLLDEAERVKRSDPSYLAHDFLEEWNHAFYLKDFIEQGARAQLCYVADLAPINLFPNLQDHAAARLAEDGGAQTYEAIEQLLDFAMGRTFRQALLAPAAARGKLQRAWEPRRREGIFLAARIQKHPKTGIYHHYHGGTIQAGSPLDQAALQVLGQQGPHALSWEQWRTQTLGLSGHREAARVDQALETLLLALLKISAVDLVGEPPPTGTAASMIPAATAYVRWEATQGQRTVTNLYQENIELRPETLKVLALLDGKTDRQALLERMFGFWRGGELVLTRGTERLKDAHIARDVLKGMLGQFLAEFERKALLVR